jgi:hypothetical protein
MDRIRAIEFDRLSDIANGWHGTFLSDRRGMKGEGKIPRIDPVILAKTSENETGCRRKAIDSRKENLDGLSSGPYTSWLIG